MRYHFIIVAIILLYLFQDLLRVPALAQSTVGSVNSVAAQVQEVLGLKHPEGSYLDALAEVIAISAKENEKLEPAIEKLVQVVAGGCKPDEFSSLLVDRTHIENPLTPKKPDLSEKQPPRKYGTFNDRKEIVIHVWSRAQQLSNQGDRRSVQFARGALLLAAHEDFIFGAPLLAICTSDPERFASVAGLTGEQQNKLLQVIGPIVSNPDRAVAFSKYSFIEAELIENRVVPVPLDKLKSAIDYLREEHRLARTLGESYSSILNAWLLRNYTYSLKDPAASRLVDDLLKEWQAESNPPAVNRWLSEALSQIGEPLKKSRVIGPGARRSK